MRAELTLLDSKLIDGTSRKFDLNQGSHAAAAKYVYDVFICLLSGEAVYYFSVYACYSLQGTT